MQFKRASDSIRVFESCAGRRHIIGRGQRVRAHSVWISSIYLALIGFCSVAVTAETHSQTQAPTLTQPPNVPGPGTSRTFKLNNEQINSTFVGREGDLFCFLARSQSGEQQTTCQNWEGSTVKRQGKIGNSAPGVFTPHSGLYSYPLFVGRQWETTYTFTSTSGEVSNRTKKARITGWQKVTVPAGTFEAFKIEAYNQLLGVKYPAYEEYFYSPVAGMIKYDSDDFNQHIELLSYTKSNSSSR